MEIIPIDIRHPFYGQVERLMEQAFPFEERRCPEDQRRVAETDPRLTVNALVSENRFVGLLTYWKLDGMMYVEHLATLPEVRGGGMGRRVMEKLTGCSDVPVVLEVEPPVDELTRRRVDFYRRCGFVLWEKRRYLQPSYHSGSGSLPLQLMVYGGLDESLDFDRVRACIHTSAYGLNTPLTD